MTFENRFSTRTVNIKITDDETKTEFGGIVEKISAEYSSDKLDLGVTIDLIGIGFHRSYAIAGSHLIKKR